MILLSNTFLVKIIKKKKNFHHYPPTLLHSPTKSSICPIYSKSKSQKEDTPYIHNHWYHYSYSTNSTFPLPQKPLPQWGQREKKGKNKKKKKKTSYPRSKFIYNRALGRDIPNISCAGKSRISLGKRNEEEAEGIVEVAPSSRNMRFPRRGTRVCPWKAVGKGSGLKEVRERKLRGGYNGRQADEEGGLA